MIILCLLIILGSISQAFGDQNKIQFNARDITANWTYPKDLVNPDLAHGVTPRYIQKNTNACIDAKEFSHPVAHGSKETVRGGIKDVGSNQKDAVNIIDGNPDTFWEPSKDVLLEDDWWIEIDLGRLLWTEKIVVRFVAEGQGDPFLEFRLLVSNGTERSESGSPLDFWQIGEIERNKTQRLFEFEVPCFLDPFLMQPEDLKGDAIQYVRLVVTGSLGNKAEEISKERYYLLNPELRGEIEYFRITPTGKEELISQEGYEKLPLESRGPVRYYRKEIPRLAEVEVWCLGDNIGLGVVDRGGFANLPNGGGIRAFDESFLTEARVQSYCPEKGRDGLVVDLGATFWVDGVRISFPPGYIINRYQLLGATGSDVGWETLAERREQTQVHGFYQAIGKEFKLQKLRLLNFRYLEPIDLEAESRGVLPAFVPVREFQIYGEGFPEIVFVSPLIELPKAISIQSIEWEGDTPERTKIETQTRTGDILKEIKHFFDMNGNEITEARYNKLPSFWKGQIKTEVVPGSGWSQWSEVYAKSGDRIHSPSRKRYIQLQVKLLSYDPNQAAILKSISVNYQPALVNGAKVKINPNILEKGAGKTIKISLTIKPSFTSEDIGFDKIMVVNPFIWVKDTRFRLPRVFKGQTELTEGSDYRQVPTENDTLLFVFPKIFKKGDIDSIEIRFTTEIYWLTQVFDVYLGNSFLPGVWQNCEAENTKLTTDEIGILRMEGGILNLEIKPKVFTPNGDGINDVVEVRFGVTTIEVAGVVVEIYDTSGRRLWRKREERPLTASGKYTFVWDGKDESGRKVPPGVYVVKVSVPRTGEVKVRTVGVAY